MQTHARITYMIYKSPTLEAYILTLEKSIAYTVYQK